MNAKSPTAAIGHMPFKGHRTVAEVWKKEDDIFRLLEERRKSREYGFDPESLKP